MSAGKSDRNEPRTMNADVQQTTAGAPSHLIQANAKPQYEVTRADLPLCCPMPDMYLWNSHPRVYLPIEETGWAKCGYCGAEYTLRR